MVIEITAEAEIGVFAIIVGNTAVTMGFSRIMLDAVMFEVDSANGMIIFFNPAIYGIMTTVFQIFLINFS